MLRWLKKLLRGKTTQPLLGVVMPVEKKEKKKNV